MSEEPEMVTISRSEYEQLKESEYILSKLEAAGVDNWEWYGEALKGDIE